MKTLRLLALVVALSAGASAQETFPGLKAILTVAEWNRAGLDRLTPDELGVIDAAIIRHQASVTAALTQQVTVAQQAAATAQAQVQAQAHAPAAAPLPEPKPGLMARFGLPTFDGDWRNVPPLKGKVVAWESANRFRLDNGQVWEGYEPITYELVGRDIEIQARPAGRFALVLDGQSTTIRVMRLR